MSDDEHDNGEEGDFADWNEEEEAETRTSRCLFSSATHPNPTAALTHAADAHGFDLRALTKQYGLDFYGTIMALNYARTVAKDRGAGEGTDAAASKDAASAAIEGIARGEHRDERFLVPTLEDDGVLFEWEEFVGADATNDAEDDDDDDDDATPTAKAGDDEDDPKVNAEIAASSTDPRVTAELAKQLTAAIAENDALKLKMLTLSVGGGGESAEDDAPANVGAALLPDGVAKSKSKSKPVPIRTKPQKSDPRPDKRSALPNTVDDHYFDGYGHFDIHRTMLDDVPRTAAYRDALESNPSLVNGARVLDVGCGTGILSMFAARGGASAVVGVDGAAPMAACARANVAHNGVDDTVVVVQGKVEELIKDGKIPGGANSYDVLVSEWMGYGLLFESMLDTVIAARDAMLKPGGAVLPDVATIHVAGFSRNATSQPFWDDVYGFEMPAVQADLREEASKLAVVHGVKSSHVCTTDGVVKYLDLATMSALDTEFSSDTVLVVARADGIRGDENDDVVKAGGGRGATGLTQRDPDPSPDHDTEPIMCHGVVVWFDTSFSERFCKEKPVVLSTSPHSERTHWAQTMLHFSEPVALVPHGSFWWGKDQPKRGLVGTRTNPAKGINIRIGMAKCKEEERARGLDISLEYEPVSADGTPGTRKAKMYQM